MISSRDAGHTFSAIVPSSIKVGDFVKVGQIVGVAETAATKKEDGQTWATIRVEGVAIAPINGSVKQGDLIGTEKTAENGKIDPKVVTEDSNVVVAGVVIGSLSSKQVRYEVKLALGWK